MAKLTTSSVEIARFEKWRTEFLAEGVCCQKCRLTPEACCYTKTENTEKPARS